MLENPTRYHVIQKQKNQVRQYLSESFHQSSEWSGHHQPMQQHQPQQKSTNDQSASPKDDNKMNSCEIDSSIECVRITNSHPQPNRWPNQITCVFQQRNEMSTSSTNIIAGSSSSMGECNSCNSSTAKVLSNISLPPYRPSLSSQQQQQPSYFQARYPYGLNASPESALSPSISSVATSASDVSRPLRFSCSNIILFPGQIAHK